MPKITIEVSQRIIELRQEIIDVLSYQSSENKIGAVYVGGIALAHVCSLLNIEGMLRKKQGFILLRQQDFIVMKR